VGKKSRKTSKQVLAAKRKKTGKEGAPRKKQSEINFRKAKEDFQGQIHIGEIKRRILRREKRDKSCIVFGIGTTGAWAKKINGMTKR